MTKLIGRAAVLLLMSGLGNYEFTEVSPGRYVLGVSLSRMADPDAAYPATFYPGVAIARDAAVIEMGAGSHLELNRLRLLPSRQAYRLTGTVVSPDGTPGPIGSSDPLA